LRYA